MTTKAEETASLLFTDFQVGDRVWWNEPNSLYHGDTGVVTDVTESHVHVWWSDGGEGEFMRNPDAGGRIVFVYHGEPPK